MNKGYINQVTLPKAVSRKLTYNAMRKIQRRSHVETRWSRRPQGFFQRKSNSHGGLDSFRGWPAILARITYLQTFDCTLRTYLRRNVQRTNRGTNTIRTATKGHKEIRTPGGTLSQLRKAQLVFNFDKREEVPPGGSSVVPDGGNMPYNKQRSVEAELMRTE